MASSMGPPPPKNPNTTTAEPQTKKALDEASSSGPMTTPMGPPPAKNSKSPQPDDSIQSQTTANHEESQSNPPQNDSTPTEDATAESSTTDKDKQEQSPNMSVPYTIPSWSGSPCHHFFLEILKDGSIIDQIDVNEKGAYMFGRVDLCDFILDHPTISRFHAVLQFKSSGDAYLYDLGSTHGTFINKNQVKGKVYVELHVGDVIRFGHTSQLYIFQGPSDLMPSDDKDEVTWQTYRGQLTEKQEKTRDKLLKRLEKEDIQQRDELAESLNDLFTSVSTMVKGELQGTNNMLELLEKMNLRVSEEYKGFGDVASGLRVFVEQLKNKSGSFDEYVQQIDAIEHQVTEFEAVISMLDKYVSLLESKVQSVHKMPPS